MRARITSNYKRARSRYLTVIYCIERMRINATTSAKRSAIGEYRTRLRTILSRSWSYRAQPFDGLNIISLSTWGIVRLCPFLLSWTQCWGASTPRLLMAQVRSPIYMDFPVEVWQSRARYLDRPGPSKHFSFAIRLLSEDESNKMWHQSAHSLQLIITTN